MQPTAEQMATYVEPWLYCEGPVGVASCMMLHARARSSALITPLSEFD